MKEAADRGLVALKAMRGWFILIIISYRVNATTDAYVAELMKNKSTGDVPKIAKFRSADVSAPYVLVCHYPDTNSKIV